MKLSKGLKERISKLTSILSDKTYLKLRYYLTFNKKLNLKNPKTYNEKLQWMKLYDRNPLYTKIVDKYEVKKYIAEKIGEEYVIPTLGIWDRFEDIDFDKLPEQFVLKCTHDSGSVLICKDKTAFDYDVARSHFARCLKHDSYHSGREWAYKDVRPRIIAEEYMEDDFKTGLRDYKFFCFDGKVKALFIATERGIEGTDVKFDFFDENFNHLPFKHGHEQASITPSMPEHFEKMKEISARLSEGFRHVRIDLYNVNGKIYFGEMTFYHHCGFVPFEPEEWDHTFGSWINID